MCIACLSYMETLDWGYPLTDNGARNLLSKYPFFLHSTKFLPYHFAKALDFGRGSWVTPSLAQFAETRQACLLVKYAASITQNGLQGNEMGNFLYWFELLDAGIDLPTSQFIHAYENELAHRRHQFGSADGRYESWKALSLLFPEDILWKRDFHLLADLSKPDKLVSGIRDTFPCLARLPSPATKSQHSKSFPEGPSPFQRLARLQGNDYRSHGSFNEFASSPYDLPR